MKQTSAGSVSRTPVPWLSQLLERVVGPLYRFFDWLFSSAYNPLYRSGTLAVGFLFVLLITGLYLSFFYSVSQPYESVVQLSAQVWFGRWVRTLHRYATVATVVAIFFHILQLLVQGKCWGPRALAWVSGVFLTLMYFVSAWSGYVMVWDHYGQQVAMAGAEMLAIIPFLHDIVKAAFDGSTAIPPGFFFMNLFLHVALPVLMILFLWVHTARLSRAVWFPIRTLMFWSTLGLIALSIAWPAPLLPGADLLRTIGRIPSDAVTGVWIAWLPHIGVSGVWLVLIAFALLLTTVPWWWRPGANQMRPISVVDQSRCTGCLQCTKDCPYEAIKMVAGKDQKHLIAEIIPNHCVSCGICAASCADLAIGPPGRAALDQLGRVEELCGTLAKEEGGVKLVLLACANNSRLASLLESYSAHREGCVLYPVECCGCVHTEVLERLLSLSQGVVLIGCPARNCFNRDGGDLLAQRVYEKRVPFLARGIDRKRILITSYSEAEAQRLLESVASFETSLDRDVALRSARPRLSQQMRASVSAVALLAACAFAAQIPLGLDPDTALIRIAGALPSSMAESCHAPTEQEVASIPLHMRPKEICKRNALTYKVELLVDDKLVLERELGDPNGRVDRPLALDLEQQVVPGNREIEARLTASDSGIKTLSCETELKVEAGKIFLIHYERDQGELRCG